MKLSQKSDILKVRNYEVDIAAKGGQQSTAKKKIKKRGRPSKPIDFWFTRYTARVYRMCQKFGNRWAEYRKPKDLTTFPYI